MPREKMLKSSAVQGNRRRLLAYGVREEDIIPGDAVWYDLGYGSNMSDVEEGDYDRFEEGLEERKLAALRVEKEKEDISVEENKGIKLFTSKVLCNDSDKTNLQVNSGIDLPSSLSPKPVYDAPINDMSDIVDKVDRFFKFFYV